jgi:hypothetical protein
VTDMNKALSERRHISHPSQSLNKDGQVDF